MALAFMLFTFGTCKKDPAEPISDCQHQAVFGDQAYNNARSDDFDLDTMWLSNDCLTVRYWYGGGCGETEMMLVGSRDKTLHLPPAISAKLSFRDRDNCEAYIQTEKSFDLKPFQQSDSKTVTIRVDGRAESFEYAY